MSGIAIGRMNLDSFLVFPVQHIFRGGLPAMLDEGLGDL
jgi:hypothetical protein